MYGIIGYGVLGKAMGKCFTKNSVDWWAEDIETQRVPKSRRFEKGHLDRTPAVFICVPTPAPVFGVGYSLTQIELALGWLRDQEYTGVVVISSTIGAGDYEHLTRNKYPFHLFVSPEFLREKTAVDDLWNAYYPTIYGPETMVKAVRGVLLAALRARHFSAYYTAVTPETCALIKQGRNLALALKLTSASLVHLNAKAALLSRHENIKVVNRVFSDPRLATSDTYHNVGQYGHKIGFGGNCLPKDVQALATDPNMPDAAKEFLEALVKFNEWMRRYYE